ncbi:MAG: hypothetical protein DLM50_01540 [Candidatus Meridianibacter frigidus]|nr:MAG: hypothetical protein DLM50_01540 [Candidatus Eremiobacteraeota bacterium]
MTLEARLWVTAAVSIALFFVLGVLVSSGPPSRIDIEGSALRGVGTPLAILFTESGRWLWLLLTGMLGVMLFAALRLPVWLPLLILLSQSLSQAVIEGCKQLFHRARPDAWLYHHELGYSYPSGHAATSVVFFGAWMILIASMPMPRALKVVLVAALGVWMIGIDWSRLALSAHYPSDVIGGTLFGIAWLCALLAMLEHFRFPLTV